MKINLFMNRFNRFKKEKNQPKPTSTSKEDSENMEMDEERLARHCVEHDWEQFCKELYKVLWAEGDGFTNPALLCHQIYDKTKIDPTAVAHKYGFPCFEEMMHCNELKDVVVIEKQKNVSKRNPNFVEIRYRATYSQKFADIRRSIKRKMGGIASQDYEQFNDFSNDGTSTTTTKELTGPLISYEVEINEMLNDDEDDENDDDGKNTASVVGSSNTKEKELIMKKGANSLKKPVIYGEEEY